MTAYLQIQHIKIYCHIDLIFCSQDANVTPLLLNWQIFRINFFFRLLLQHFSQSCAHRTIHHRT